jgi:hypothetical protein
MVYSEDLNPKLKEFAPFAEYRHLGHSRVYALQFQVEKDSPEHKKLFNILQLKKKHQVKA